MDVEESRQEVAFILILHNFFRLIVVIALGANAAVYAQELGSTMVLKKTQFIAEQLAKMSEAERAAFRCPGQDSEVPVLNSFPVMYGDDEPSLCKNFPVIDHALVERDPKFSRTSGDRTRAYRAGEMIVVLVHVMNTALPITPTRDTTAKRVTLEDLLGPDKANGFWAGLKGENTKHMKKGEVRFGHPPGCSAILLQNSGAVYDYKGFRIGPSRQNIGKGKFLVGDIKPGWENSRFITVLFRVIC